VEAYSNQYAQAPRLLHGHSLVNKSKEPVAVLPLLLKSSHVLHCTMDPRFEIALCWMDPPLSLRATLGSSREKHILLGSFLCFTKKENTSSSSKPRSSEVVGRRRCRRATIVESRLRSITYSPSYTVAATGRDDTLVPKRST